MPLKKIKVCVCVYGCIYLFCYKIAPCPRSVTTVCFLCLAGFLISLLTQLTHHHALTMYHDADTQTPTTSSYGESLGIMKLSLKHHNILYSTFRPHSWMMTSIIAYTVEKMKLIDKEYENFSYSGDRWTSVESRLAAYRKEIEAQMQAEMKTKVCSLSS